MDRVDGSMIERGPSPFIPGFRLLDVALSNGVVIRSAIGGNGPPLLLLHGHPQTHVVWRKIAPRLAERFTVVASDLRGYGDSSKPDGGPGHSNYSKRAMAQDQVELMDRLGFARFPVVGHDRGGRVAHRMALDHALRVERLCVLDIAPTATMYARTDKAFATRYFWWFFLIQPAPLPETMIGADPEFFLRKHLEGQSGTSGSVEPDIFAEYLRCYLDPATRHAICEDYRAAATIDLEHDAEDARTSLTMPVLALWGEKGTVGALYDVVETWREKASHVSGRALACGHNLPEDVPGPLLEELLAFLDTANV